MTARAHAIDVAKQILNAPDLGWIQPLAREFLVMVEREEQPVVQLCSEAGRIVPGGVRESGA